MSNNAPALQEPKQRRSVVDLLRDPKTVAGMEAVATQYLTPDRMAKIVVNAIHRTPKLKDCNPQSLLGAVMMSCSLGLEPNTPMGQAYLIPFDKRGKDPKTGQWGVIGTDVNFIIGYKGYIALAKRNPKLVKLYASTVHENDLFEYMEGSESFLKFQPAMRGRGEPIGAFCFTKERGEFGDIDAATVLPMDELEKIRSCSETYNFLSNSVESAKNDYQLKKAQEKLADTPWVKWFGEMAAKSAIRRHVKQLDLTAHLAAAVAIDESAETGRMDMGKLVDADYTRAIAQGETTPELKEPEQPEEPSRPSLVDNSSQETVVNTADFGGKTREQEKVATSNETATGQQQQEEPDPKEAEKTKKQNLAAFAKEYDIKLDLRKTIADLEAEVQQIREGTHPDLQQSEEAQHDPETGEVQEGDSFDFES